MDIERFLNLPIEQVAQFVRNAGPKVCVFPINGTRRWFLLEYPPERWGGRNFLNAYHQLSVERQLDLYRMFFNHGIDTLMMPLLGPDLMERGPAYQQVILGALVEMATEPVFLNFYEEYGVRVRFYGDYRKHLGCTPFAYACDAFDRLAEKTAHNDRFRLFYGLFAHDATETTAALSVRFYQEHGVLPDKRKLIEMYYGEFISPVSLFIGFDKFSAFDMPLVSSGSEDLYFTVSPSFSLNENQLRSILYDHLFTRRVEEQDYEMLTPEAVEWMRSFYQTNQDVVLGVGVIRDGIWYPLTGKSSISPALEARAGG